MSNNPQNQSKWYFGGVASVTATMVTHPIDLLKVRLQVQPNKQFGLLGMIRDCITKEGLRGLYAGFDASLLRQISLNIPRLGFYEIYKNKYCNGIGLTTSDTLIASCISGIIGGFMGNPADVVNVRMQNDKRLPLELRRNYKHVFNGLISIIKSEGFLSLFKGITITSIRAVFVTLGQAGGYDQMKFLFVNHQVFNNDLHTYFMSGLGAGLAVSIFVNPIDVVKARYMNATPNEYKNIIDCIRKISSESICKFYAGLLPSFLRIGPHAVILFLVKEYLTTNFGTSKV